MLAYIWKDIYAIYTLNIYIHIYIYIFYIFISINVIVLYSSFFLENKINVNSFSVKSVSYRN